MKIVKCNGTLKVSFRFFSFYMMQVTRQAILTQDKNFVDFFFPYFFTRMYID